MTPEEYLERRGKIMDQYRQALSPPMKPTPQEVEELAALKDMKMQALRGVLPAPKIWTRVSRFTVSCLPEGFEDASSWDLFVENRGPDSWGILSRGCCLGRDGEWDYEPSPARRSAEWLKQHRYNGRDALKRAAHAAPYITVNGWTPQEVLYTQKAEH